MTTAGDRAASPERSEGDCILGARIDLQADWQEILTDRLTQEAISLAA